MRALDNRKGFRYTLLGVICLRRVRESESGVSRVGMLLCRARWTSFRAARCVCETVLIGCLLDMSLF